MGPGRGGRRLQVVVKDGRQVIAKGHANAEGTAVFASTKLAKGTHHLSITGATNQRRTTPTLEQSGH